MNEEKEEVELLDEIQDNKEEPKEQINQKIEIVEHKESKFDNLKSREEQFETEVKSKEPQSKKENRKPLNKKKTIITIILVIIIVIIVGSIWFVIAIRKVREEWTNITTDKPIIYIYPEEETKVKITVSNPENFTVTYPKYNEGWEVTAKEDGTLIDKNNKEYYALYWEGKNNNNKIKEDGFVIKGEDTSTFLEDKLKLLGLNNKETNEFIIYWLPKLEKNEYNYIRFQTREEINNYMKLNIEPTPDTLIRVLMEYKPLEKKIKVKEQKLQPVERQGYTIVEWGGTEIKK